MLRGVNGYYFLLFRVRPRFFDQVGHETMYASSGNYEQPPQTYQNSFIQSQFSV